MVRLLTARQPRKRTHREIYPDKHVSISDDDSSSVKFRRKIKAYHSFC